MHPYPAEATMAAELAVVRPGLLPAFTAGLAGARAAVLTRLWRGLAHDPLRWVERREPARDVLVLRLRDGRRLHGPAPDPYATDAYVTQVRLDGVRYEDPARLVTALGSPDGGPGTTGSSDSAAAAGRAPYAGFAGELDHSAVSLALSRANRPQGGAGWPVDGWEWERRVTDGHPYHPNCRSRPGFSTADQLAYGPEHGPLVELGLVPVAAGHCLVSGCWPKELRDGRRLLLPVHPWQAAHVLKATPGPGPSARPLMSLRTLEVPGGPHVKTALSTRLTSSVRDMSTGSVAAAAALSVFGEQLAARTDGLLHLTRTLGAATAGSPGLAALLREPPQVYAAGDERVVPVAALPSTGLPGRAGWQAAFARLALGVGLRVLELGVALEAHGQNLLVVLSASGDPLRLVYRDMADIRVSPVRLARHGIALPAGVPARVLTDDVEALRRKLFGSLVAGALAGTAGSRAALRAALEAAVGDLPRTPDLEALTGRPLPAKALTSMRLSPGAPGGRWTRLPNPLR